MQDEAKLRSRQPLLIVDRSASKANHQETDQQSYVDSSSLSQLAARFQFTSSTQKLSTDEKSGQRNSGA